MEGEGFFQFCGSLARARASRSPLSFCLSQIKCPQSRYSIIISSASLAIAQRIELFSNLAICRGSLACGGSLLEGFHLKSKRGSNLFRSIIGQ
ncbi:Uncharacterized protein TCM_030548 [Theobroma cacao]|uniref:Uncharacterized protein n=1 Tax=Theobroma cacao TaxID=3641 RepID=A0A061F5D0_THECC|nr:Uncharacterized protein TCM_030548 [Theobroma cacao]